MAKPIPTWGATIDRDGKLHMDAISLFRRYCGTLKNQAVTVTVKKLARSKSRSQLGYLFGVVYPVIADELGYREYEVEQVHDALMRELRGLQPEPNPLQLRVSLSAMPHEEVSAYIEDVRAYALDSLGIVTPDAGRVEIPEVTRKRSAA